jgi:hypothetical protein
MVLFFGLASRFVVIPRFVLWDIPGIRSGVSSRRVGVCWNTSVESADGVVIRGSFEDISSRAAFVSGFWR